MDAQFWLAKWKRNEIGFHALHAHPAWWHISLALVLRRVRAFLCHYVVKALIYTGY